MLDKRSVSLLEYFNKQCVSGGYKIFSIEELVSVMPKHFGIDVFGIEECIRALSEREYISVKHKDDKEVCLCPLTKGRLVFENRIENEIATKKTEKKYYLSSFFGAISGAVTVGAVYMLARFFWGV